MLLSELPEPNSKFIDEKKDAFWSDLIKLRVVVNKALEQARSVRSIGSSLEAQVRVAIGPEELAKKASMIENQLPAFFITSQVQLVDKSDEVSANGQTLAFVDEDGIQVAVLTAAGKKCIRCWKFTTDVGANSQHPEICGDCVVVITASSS